MRPLALLFIAVALGTAPMRGEERGQAEIALQGYYFSDNSQPRSDIDGAAVRFQYLSSRYGLFRGSVDGYGGESRFRQGNNFIELSGLPWQGSRWTFAAGDLRVPLTITGFPFQNIYYPETGFRGLKIEAGGRNYRYRVLWGRETLSNGPRIVFRTTAPQRIFSVNTDRKIGDHLLLSASWMRLSGIDLDKPENQWFFAENRRFDRVNRLAVQALYSPTEPLRFFIEATSSQASEAARLSTVSGVSYETLRWTARANYVQQGAAYLPLAGYFLGDRRGPFGEVRVRLRSRIELFGSSSRYANNLEKRPDVPLIRSSTVSAGTTVTLPFRFTATGQITALNYQARPSAEDAFRSSMNRQMSFSLARPIQRHTVRFSARELRLSSFGLRDHQRSAEIEDTFSRRRWLMSGAARWQQSTTGGQNRQSLFYRGLLRGSLGPLSAYGNYEAGNDLLNRSVFATNTVRVLGGGAGVRMPGRWDLQVDAFRNNFISSLNPESVFLLETQGIGPSLFLSQLNQWNLYFRLARQFNWGGALPMVDHDAFGGEHIPLLESVEGFVFSDSSAGRQPAPGIPVLLDGSRGTTTDEHGKYHFAEVPEGPHDVGISLDELPADFNPGLKVPGKLLVVPNRVARADLDIRPLLGFEGRIVSPGGVVIEDVVVTLHPGSRSTTTDRNGRFAFYNLPEGEYEAVVDTNSLPENTSLTAPAARVRLQLASPVISPNFTLVAVPEPAKPVRRIQILTP